MHPVELDRFRHVPMLEEEMPDGSHFQLYENVSEGTPISPVFASKDELWRWVESVRRGRKTLTWPDIADEYMRILSMSPDPLAGLYVPSALLRRLIMISRTDAYRAMGSRQRRRARYRVCLQYRYDLRSRGESVWRKWPWPRCVRVLAEYESVPLTR